MARFSLSPPASAAASLRQQQRQQHSSPSDVAVSTTTPQWKWNFPPRKYPAAVEDDDDDDADSSSAASSSPSSYSDAADDDDDIDDNDDDNSDSEPPHPLGFESRYGNTRFGLSPHYQNPTTTSSLEYHRRSDIFNREDEYAWNALIRIDDDNERNKQQESFVSPIRSYHLENRGVASTKMLLRGMTHPNVAHDTTTMDELSKGIDRIANLVKAATTYRDDPSEGMSSLITPRQLQQQHHQLHYQSPSTTTSPHTSIPPPRSTSRLLQLAMECERHQHALSNEISSVQSTSEAQYQQHCQGFLLLLQAEAKRVQLAQERISQRQEQAKQLEEMDRLEREELERQYEEQRQEQERKQSEHIAAEAARTQKEHEKEQHRLELLAIAEQEAEKEAAAKYQYISRAQDLILHLDRVRSSSGSDGSLHEFDKSPMVSKRRLQFKKIVNGKINTLAHDGKKILEVSSLVWDTISNAEKEDTMAAATSSGGAGGGVMTMGKKYLLDLLCSNLIVRVQADGFNGTRGDGFPLAGMFAQISRFCEEICPLLEGHLYTVCRMAIPALSLEKGGDGVGRRHRSGGGTYDSNDDLMESLGMIRDKDGEFESFEKFLHRTEGLISIMANIMSSLPADHTLLGGHSGALIWLQRFMDLLPPPPASPLPLLTAPVLVAFLSGAGHMLANKYPSEFTSLLAVMKDDLLHRLDETPIGVPSATRLKKVLEDIGLEGLRRDLPQGAVAELYNMTSSHSQGLSSSFSPFGQKTLGGISGADGGNHSSTSTNRGDIVSSQDLAFHVSSTASPLPVDNTNNMSEEGPVTSPFGSGLFGSSSAASSASPFGGQSSLFGTTSVAAPTQSPFGGGAVQSSGFGSMTGAFASNRAGGSGLSSGFMSAPAPATMTTTIAAPSPFSSFPTSGTSPFGMAVPTNPSPFGATSASSSSTFGAAPTPAASAFGALAPSPSPFGTGSAAPNPSPFGTAPSAFGTAPASSPFSSAPFGSSPFGGNTTTSAHGPSPFSMSNSGVQGFGQGGGGGDSSKQPCKFFASGTCNFGDRCKFSHELGASQGSGGSSNMSAFGVSSRQPTNAFGGGGSKPPCKFFASGSCRNGNSCPFSHDIPGVGGVGGGTSGFGSSSTPFGGAGFGQSTNPSPFSGGPSSGGGFGNFGLGNTNPSPFSASSASNNPFGGPRR